MRKVIASIIFILPVVAHALTEVVDGITWTYTVSGGKASVGGGVDGWSIHTAIPSTTEGNITIPSSLGGYPVTCIETGAFVYCVGLTSVVIPNSVTSIDAAAFAYCSGLSSITIPDSVTSIEELAFVGCGELMRVRYMGLPYATAWDNEFLSLECSIEYPAVYEAEWRRFLKSRGVQFSLGRVIVRSSQIRDNDPTVMDVRFLLGRSGAFDASVKVRALAFEDGERSFAKVVRPETFVNDPDGNPTAQNIGDNVAANVEHKLSWKVSSDWATRLAKVKFEVLACDGALLPMETTIIPASDRYGKMQIVWNRHTNDQIFDALLWLYADKAAGLTLVNGALKAGGKTLANGTSLSDAAAAAEFVYRSMGFDGALSGDLLNYVNEETRLGLSPDGVRQYAYKMVEE